MQVKRPVSAILAVLTALTLLGSGCGILGGGDDSASDITVLQALMATQLNDQQQIVGNPLRAFPEDTNHVYAVLVIQGVGIGDEVTGRWYQLSVQDTPAEGTLVSEASVTLDIGDLTEDAGARVALDLGMNAGNLPVGDWLLRVYVNGEFIRTMGFVVTPLVASGAGSGVIPTPTPEASPTPEPSPEPTQPPAATPTPETYTVQPGDSLSLIAQNFKSPDETIDQYIDRLAELNQLEPGSFLFVGQVLILPGNP